MTDNYGTKDQNFRTASEKWDLVDSLMGGTDAMRAAGTDYLPKHTQEDDDTYKIRLERSTLYNKYKNSVEANVGKITSTPVQLEGGSTFLQEFKKNVDSTGRSLNEFAKDVLKSSINHGVSYILVDFPVDTDGITLANMKDVKPHFVDINATQVLSIRSSRINGIEELIYFKFSLQTQEAFESWDSQTDTYTDQIREFAKVDNQVVYRVKQKTANGWETISEGTMAGLEFIPIIPMYSNRTGFMMGEPLLNDLAELNIKHWRVTSDQQFGLHYASNPLLVLKGIDNRDENGNKVDINVGPNSVITTERADADVSFAEHSGSAFNTLANFIETIERQMETMSLNLSVDRTGNMTATGRAIDAASASATLKSVAVQVEDTLTAALLIVELFYGSTAEFTVAVNKEYIPVGDTKDMSIIQDIFNMGILTQGDVLREAKRRNLISPQFVIAPELNDKKVTNTTTEE